MSAGDVRRSKGLAKLDTYLRTEFASVEGWCLPSLWGIVSACHDYQIRNGIDGPIAEIGVYQGKFFIGLALLKPSDRPHYAIDVFDMQEFNLDGAGAGNLERFEANVARSGIAPEQFRSHQADSMALNSVDIEKIRRDAGPFSMFSVDGCHMVEHTINDLRIALELTHPGGIIFIDDYYNPHWPGVQEGIHKIYFNESPRFVPLLFTCNKLFLCHISRHAKYLHHVRVELKKNYPAWRIKTVPRFGYETLTVMTVMQGEFLLAY